MKNHALLSGALLALGGFALPAIAADKVDFAKDIRPIFAESCYKCHGAEKQKGDLRLDNADAIKKGGKDGAVLTAGDAEKSDLYHRLVLPAGDDDIMPPKGGPLPKEKIELVKKWITEGGDFGTWKADSGKEAAGTPAVAAGPAEIKLPTVPAGDVGVITKLREGGANVLPLAQNTNLLEVSFPSSSDKVNDDVLGQLSNVSQQVVDLNLAGTKITNKGLASLEKMTNLRRLHLEKTAVGDEGLDNLATLKDLEYLNLYNTSITDAGVAKLAALKNLKRVYLWQSKATDEGAAKLKAALPNVTIDMGWKEPPTTKDVAKDDAKKDEKPDAKKAVAKDDAKPDAKKEVATTDGDKKDDTKKDEPPAKPKKKKKDK